MLQCLYLLHLHTGHSGSSDAGILWLDMSIHTVSTTCVNMPLQIWYDNLAVLVSCAHGQLLLCVLMQGQLGTGSIRKNKNSPDGRLQGLDQKLAWEFAHFASVLWCSAL